MKDISILSVIPLMGILLIMNIVVWIRMKILLYSRKDIVIGLIITNTVFFVVIIYGIVTNKLINE